MLFAPSAGRKITMMVAAQTGHYRDPLARITFEGGNLVGVDNVFDVAGNHEISPLTLEVRNST